MGVAMIGAAVGVILGIIGAIIGIICSIKNTRDSGEKKFIKKMVLVIWLAGVLFILGIVLIPRPYNFFMFLPYFTFLALFVVWGNKAQKKLRSAEAVLAAGQNCCCGNSGESGCQG